MSVTFSNNTITFALDNDVLTITLSGAGQERVFKNGQGYAAVTATYTNLVLSLNSTKDPDSYRFRENLTFNKDAAIVVTGPAQGVVTLKTNDDQQSVQAVGAATKPWPGEAEE